MIQPPEYTVEIAYRFGEVVTPREYRLYSNGSPIATFNNPSDAKFIADALNLMTPEQYLAALRKTHEVAA